MKSQWFYIRRFKACRPNWHIAKRYKETGSIYLVEDSQGSRFTSTYYEAEKLLQEIQDLGNRSYDYRIVNEADLGHVEKLFKKERYDDFE